MYACTKCAKVREGSLNLIGGRMFFLCDHCALGTLTSAQINEIPENWVTRRIRMAKEARERGEFVWLNL
jgi:hypothetical protein